MLTKSLLAPMLEDDSVTRGLGDAEARMLVEWLIDEAECRAEESPSEETAQMIAKLARWARGVAKFIHLWCYLEAHGSAIQLAASEGFGWPLPTTRLDPCELLELILQWQHQAGELEASILSRCTLQARAA